MSDAGAGAYRAACTAAGVRLLKTVEEAYASGMPALLLNGNRTVELLSSRLIDVEVAPLSVALCEGNPFTAIDLSYNELNAGAAESIGLLLKSDTTLTVLNLAQNDLGPEAASTLCAVLKDNKSLRQLSLGGNKLGGNGGMDIAEMLQTNASLQRLDLANCELTTESLVALATVLRENDTLQALDVSRPLTKTIMDEPAQHFARMLKVNSSLAELDLSKAGLRDYGMQLICEELFRAGPASGLEVLRVRGNKIQLVQPDCVEALSNWLQSDECRLAELSLGANDLRDEGALKLAEMVGGNRSLRVLDVTSNSLMSRGLCALARAANEQPLLEDVSLMGNSFDSAACLAWEPRLGALALDFSIQKIDGAYHCVDCR